MTNHFPGISGGIIQHIKKVRLRRALHTPDLVIAAICNQKLEMVKMLLEVGCSPNNNPEDCWRRGPLFEALSKLPEAIDILIDGESTNPFYLSIL